MMSLNSVRELKHDWLCDPCWDIEDTEGFEIFRDELRTFQAEKEVSWATDRMAELQELSVRLGCPGNLDLARMFQVMESRIDRLASSVIKLEDSAP